MVLLFLLLILFFLLTTQKYLTQSTLFLIIPAVSYRLEIGISARNEQREVGLVCCAYFSVVDLDLLLTEIALVPPAHKAASLAYFACVISSHPWLSNSKVRLE